MKRESARSRDKHQIVLAPSGMPRTRLAWRRQSPCSLARNARHPNRVRLLERGNGDDGAVRWRSIVLGPHLQHPNPD